MKGEAAFENVSFGYDAAQPGAQVDLTFKVPAGSRTVAAVVGATGAGKTSALPRCCTVRTIPLKAASPSTGVTFAR